MASRPLLVIVAAWLLWPLLAYASWCGWQEFTMVWNEVRIKGIADAIEPGTPVDQIEQRFRDEGFHSFVRSDDLFQVRYVVDVRHGRDFINSYSRVLDFHLQQGVYRPALQSASSSASVGGGYSVHGDFFAPNPDYWFHFLRKSYLTLLPGACLFCVVILLHRRWLGSRQGLVDPQTSIDNE